jgi:hypothetical protein
MRGWMTHQESREMLCHDLLGQDRATQSMTTLCHDPLGNNGAGQSKMKEQEYIDMMDFLLYSSDSS